MRLPARRASPRLAQTGAAKGRTKGATSRERGDQRGAVDRRHAEAGAQRIVVRQQPVELRPDLVQMREVADAQRPSAGLVLVRRADAAPGGADLAGAAGVLAQAVELAVQRQDQRAEFADLEVGRRDLDALAAQLLDLGLEMPGIEDDAVADHRQRAADDAAGQQAELVDLVADDQRVAGVVPALEADDDIGARRQPVDDLALALVAPLRADDDDVSHA